LHHHAHLQQVQLTNDTERSRVNEAQGQLSRYGQLSSQWHRFNIALLAT